MRVVRKKALHSAAVLALCVVVSAVSFGCASKVPKSSTTAPSAAVPIAKPETSPKPETPSSDKAKVSYTTAALKDISSQNNKRVRLSLVVAPRSDESSVRQAVEHAVKALSRTTPVNAVQVFVYDRDADVERDYTLAKVDWAPNGVWADAGKVKSGDYTTHKFVYNFRAKVTNPSSDSRPSDLDFRLNDAFWTLAKSNPKALEAELINSVSKANGVSPAQVKTSLEICLLWVYQ